MTLLELLVQELPKLGGWPEGYAVASNGINGVVVFHSKGRAPLLMGGLNFSGTGCVSYEEYEDALAVSNQVTWSGEGLPPVGTLCEVLIHSTEWIKIKVIAVSNEYLIAERNNSETILTLDGLEFREITEKKHSMESAFDEYCKNLIKWINDNGEPHAIIIIDGTSAVLYSGGKSLLTEEYIKD